MKYLAKSQARKFTNSPTCTVYEYAFGDSEINGALGIVEGRYPESDWIVNEKCKELVYVISGEGSLHTRSQTKLLSAGDAALIEPGEAYYFKGKDLNIFMPCTPAWYSEQHKTLS